MPVTLSATGAVTKAVMIAVSNATVKAIFQDMDWSDRGLKIAIFGTRLRSHCMRPHTNTSVTITESGRSGTVIYVEDGRSITGWWEFGGGDAVAIVNMGDAGSWEKQHPWATDRRSAILRYVGDEVIRQKAGGCKAGIDEDGGWITLKKYAMHHRDQQAAAWYERHRKFRSKLALIVGGAALALGVVFWLKGKLLTIDPGKGTPIGSSIRTSGHVATLIQTLEPYTPSPARDHSRDTYSISLFIVPLDGSSPELVPISGAHAGNSLGLARILGGDGDRIWYNVNGIGAVDIKTHRPIANSDLRDAPPAGLEGAIPFPIAPRIEASLASGIFINDDEWLGVITQEEARHTYAPQQWLRPIAHAEGKRQQRHLHRGEVGETSSTGSRRILAIEAIGNEEYLDAAFLRINEKSEPLRLHDPDGVLMIFTSGPGMKGTLMVARVDTSGQILWSTGTAIDRFGLRQILPGPDATVFIGTRLPEPGKVSEPLLVIVDNASGSAVTHSLWQ